MRSFSVILPPSSGCTGMRLKTVSTALIPAKSSRPHTDAKKESIAPMSGPDMARKASAPYDSSVLSYEMLRPSADMESAVGFMPNTYIAAQCPASWHKTDKNRQKISSASRKNTAAENTSAADGEIFGLKLLTFRDIV